MYLGGRYVKPFLSVYGHVSIDQIITVDEFPRPNTSVDALEKELRLGGISTNISVRASSMKVPTAACSFVGSDFPKDFEKFMKDSGVIMNEFVKIDGHYTSTALIVNNSKMDQTVCFLQGAQGCASSHGIELIKNAEKSDAVHFSTGDPDYYIGLMKKLSGKTKITFDPAQEIRDKWINGRFQTALELSDRFFCNEHEAKAAMDYLKIDSLSKIKKELVVCTRGSKGSEAYFDGKKVDIPAIKSKKVVDPTGAGDAFRAGFYSGIFHKCSIDESLIIASAAASFAVEAVGSLSNIPSWDEVLERADRELTR